MQVYRSYIRPFLQHPLNKKNRVGAIMNFLRWQMLLRHAKRNGSFIVAPYIGGLRCIVRKGMHGMTGNLYSGLLEFNEMGLLLHFLREGDLFFDVGANVGIYTLLASGVKGATSHSFEPLPETFSFLKMNIALNNLEGKVRLFNMGVGDEEGTLEFSADQDTENAVVSNDYKGKKIKVPIISLDKTFTGNISQCTMVKIDTEGFEDRVLKGATRLLANENVKIILVEMNNAIAITELLTGLGFVPYSYDPVSRKLSEAGLNPQANSIFVRDLSFVKDRIATAPAIEIRKGQFI